MTSETVGSLLALIAHVLNDAIRTFTFADKRGWSSDEFEQLRLLEDVVDDAKKDFQELSILLNGQFYYENDGRLDSLADLHAVYSRVESLAQCFKDWVRSGGPRDPTWARETMTISRDLHRAQCRAARRIYLSGQESSTRCLGALLVNRAQRSSSNAQERNLEELVACNSTGHFERLGEHDIAFVCDYCDGYVVWEDLRSMPSRRSAAVAANTAIEADKIPEPMSATSTTPLTSLSQDSWQATGTSVRSGEETKTIVFAAFAIANHLAPESGEWQAPLLCPYCDEIYYEEQGTSDMDQMRYVQDEGGFEHLRAFQEHLEWYHAAPAANDSSTCTVM